MTAYGPDPDKNCLFWDVSRREQMGCGSTCECAKRKDDLWAADNVAMVKSHLDAGSITIEDIPADLADAIREYRNAEVGEKNRRVQQAETVASLLGKKKNTPPQSPRKDRRAP